MRGLDLQCLHSFDVISFWYFWYFLVLSAVLVFLYIPNPGGGGYAVIPTRRVRHTKIKGWLICSAANSMWCLEMDAATIVFMSTIYHRCFRMLRVS